MSYSGALVGSLSVLPPRPPRPRPRPLPRPRPRPRLWLRVMVTPDVAATAASTMAFSTKPKHVSTLLTFVYKAVEHSNSTINHVTKPVCRNSMSVCGRNRHDIACSIGHAGMIVKEMYNEWYKTLCNEETDCVSAPKKEWLIYNSNFENITIP